MRIHLDTRQKVQAFNRNARLGEQDAKLGDYVNIANRCATCFQRDGDHDPVECYREFPPVLRVRAQVGVECPCCHNIMLQDDLKQLDQRVIMCANAHCPENGKAYKPPTVRLERLFE